MSRVARECINPACLVLPGGVAQFDGGKRLCNKCYGAGLSLAILSKQYPQIQVRQGSAPSSSSSIRPASEAGPMQRSCVNPDCAGRGQALKFKENQRLCTQCYKVGFNMSKIHDKYPEIPLRAPRSQSSNWEGKSPGRSVESPNISSSLAGSGMARLSPRSRRRQEREVLVSEMQRLTLEVNAHEQGAARSRAELHKVRRRLIKTVAPGDGRPGSGS